MISKEVLRIKATVQSDSAYKLGKASTVVIEGNIQSGAIIQMVPDQHLVIKTLVTGTLRIKGGKVVRLMGGIQPGANVVIDDADLVLTQAVSDSARITVSSGSLRGYNIGRNCLVNVCRSVELLDKSGNDVSIGNNSIVTSHKDSIFAGNLGDGVTLKAGKTIVVRKIGKGSHVETPHGPISATEIDTGAIVKAREDVISFFAHPEARLESTNSDIVFRSLFMPLHISSHVAPLGKVKFQPIAGTLGLIEIPQNLLSSAYPLPDTNPHLLVEDGIVERQAPGSQKISPSKLSSRSF